MAGLVVLLNVLAFAGCSAGQSDTDPNDRLVLGGGKTFTLIPPADRKPAAVASGPDLDGSGTVTTANPGKVTVINVWGSWCAPCRLEAPDLNAASVETSADAVFVGINVRDYDPAPARAFVRAFEIPYAHIYDPQGAQLVRFAGDLAPNAIPSTLIIDREGRTAARLVGEVSETTLVQLVREIGEGR